MSDTSKLSRRTLLEFGGAVALLCLGAQEAQAKSSQGAVAYRNAPKGGQRCANCMYFEAPGSCSVVRGAVSARGWCSLWG